MMKRTLSYLFCACAILCGTLSCVKELQLDANTLYDDTPGVHLYFSLGEDTPVKAGITGTQDGTSNENVINTIDYFLYQQGNTSSNAMVHGHVAAEQISVGTSRDGTAVAVPAYSVNVGDAMMKSLFSGGANGSQCDVYIIANYPGTIDHEGNTSLTYLQSLVVNTTFKNTEQTQFVMDGQGTATMIDRTKIDAAEGVIEMQRLASKITLDVHCVRYVDVVNTIIGTGPEPDTTYQTVRWTPMLSGMKANLCMGKQQGRMDGSEVMEAPTFKYTKADMTRDESIDTLYHSIPFYSYPRTWHNGDEEEPYIKLELPWSTGGNQKQFYYKIPLAGQAIEKNNWYHIVLNVAIIGGEDFEAGVEITGKYYVVPWETHFIINAEAEIVEARYLTVPRSSYTLYNQNTLTIPFVSSHDCVIKDITFSRPNTRNNPVTTDTYVNETDTVRTINLGAGTGGTLTVNDRTIEFSHTLLNDISQSTYDTSPYTLTFTLCHEDAIDDYTETITVTQEPAMVINVRPNSDANSTMSSSGHTAEDGYVFENGTRSNTDQSATRNNTNFNMYVITTSVLPSSGQLASYMLGDPRQEEYNNTLGSNDNTWSVSRAPVDGGSNRRISYYRPSGEDTAFDDVIAPSFRIASSFGASAAMNRTDALQRCASYQEDGYPAGRWRLPTVAEIVFMAKLTTDKVIPRLLGNNTNGSTTNYWCNSGYATVYGGNSTTPPASSHSYNNSTTCNVRCVYDEWFWSKSDYPTVSRTTFNWGDQDL